MASGALWIGVIVAAFVFLDLLFVELRRVFRELNRLVTRIEAYGELPIFSLLAAGEADMDRIARAVEAVPPLIERARSAIAVVRRYLPKGSSPG
jgi:hypothetical protein